MPSPAQGGEGHFFEVAGRREAVAKQSVRDLRGGLSHRGPDRGKQHGRRAEPVPLRDEQRWHQREAVELAAKIQLMALVPGARPTFPDRAQREHELPHPGSRL